MDFQFHFLEILIQSSLQWGQEICINKYPTYFRSTQTISGLNFGKHCALYPGKSQEEWLNIPLAYLLQDLIVTECLPFNKNLQSKLLVPLCFCSKCEKYLPLTDTVTPQLIKNKWEPNWSDQMTEHSIPPRVSSWSRLFSALPLPR